jgi:uncharacterized protein YkwD
MVLGALGLLLAVDCPRRCPPVAADDQRAPLRAAIAAADADAGQCPPCEDPALSEAAQAIASGPGRSLPEPLALQRAVQEAGAGDPSPRASLFVAGDWRTLARDVGERWPPPPADQVVGLGVAQGVDGIRAVVLSAERKIALDPLPRRVPAGADLQVRGRLLGALSGPSLYVEGPDGSVTQVKATVNGSQFSASFEPTGIGRYLLEVMARGPRGPEVLFLKPVDVGSSGAAAVSNVSPVGPDNPSGVLETINQERQRSGAPALAEDARLARVAQAYAQELRELGIFAHVSPRSGDLKARLKRAGYPFTSAAENLAQGPSALQAQALATHSPAHRRAMLDPQYTRCGVGVSRVLAGDGHFDVLLVEVFARDGE